MSSLLPFDISHQLTSSAHRVTECPFCRESAPAVVMTWVAPVTIVRCPRWDNGRTDHEHDQRTMQKPSIG